MNPTLNIQIGSETKITFKGKYKQPNNLTIQAMEELDSGGGHKVNSVDELFKELTDSGLVSEFKYTGNKK